ncbi:FAD-dependent oxidoreductase [Dysgonomonas sp. 521]|uniref:protoporphyrinogen/coproporphyrinogen oxidase n=1 Tax=Dysgonomonas sp. 521 TaxID=2302932 RepID=UPI0013D76A5C|nr:FAD-dependent oxidoreductase [Dysgonomonas sp. 521]NDV95778.1 FAD-dependent oxidoreductase [Dysgonomonas sp. 521]
MSETVYDCVVVGGGISGITFAHYLKKEGKTVLILEKNENPGGQLQTGHLSSQPDYWYELGSHTCYNSYTSLLSIIKEIGKTDLIEPLSKHSFVLYASGKIKSIASEVSKLSCLFHFPRYFFSDKTGKTTREYFRPIVGPSNYDRLFTNAFKAVICQPADDYPAEIFLKKRKDREKGISRRFTFKGGLSSFINAVIEKDNMEVNTQSKVTGVKKEGEIFQITTGNGQTFKAQNIALAANPKISSDLLQSIEPELAELLSSIPIFESESVNITIAKDKIDLKKIAGIISLSNEFLSAVSRDLVDDDRYRSFTFHFEKGKKTEVEKQDLICRVLNISASDIIEIKSMEHSLPAMRLRHLHMDEKVQAVRKDKNVYMLGNYYYGLSLEDCVNRSKDEFERFIK